MVPFSCADILLAQPALQQGKTISRPLQQKLKQPETEIEYNLNEDFELWCEWTDVEFSQT